MAPQRPARMLVHMAKVAIPVFRSRVAPVFDSCLRVWVIHIEGDVQTERTELHLDGLSPAERVRALAGERVTTLICAGISKGLYALLKRSGVCVMCGIAGRVEEVLAAFMSDRLDEPQFHMPGSRGKKKGG
jgi:predicted Fe-Mo cluster-binding NifX family protein